MHPKHMEIVRRNTKCSDSLGRAGACQIEPHIRRRSQVLERTAVVPPEFKLLGAKLTHPKLSLIDKRNSHDPLRLGVWKRAQEYSVDDCKDRRVRADAESECEDGNRRETRIAPQLAEAVADILKKVF